MLWWCKLMIYVKSECLAIAKLYWNFTAKAKLYKRSRIHQKSKRNRIYKYLFASCSDDVLMVIFWFADLNSVTMVNQDHLNSVIQFALDRREPGTSVACITTQYHTLSIQSNWNRTRVLWHLPFYLVTVVAVEVLPLVLLFLFTVVVVLLLLLHCCVVVL